MDKKELIIKCIKRLFSNPIIIMYTCYIILYIIALPFTDTEELIIKIYRFSITIKIHSFQSSFFSPTLLAMYSFLVSFEIITIIWGNISRETKDTIKFLFLFTINIGLTFVISYYGLGKLLLLYFPLSKDLISFITSLSLLILVRGTSLYISEKNNAKYGVLFFEDRFSDINKDYSMQRIDDMHLDELVLKVTYILLGVIFIIGAPLLFAIMQAHAPNSKISEIIKATGEYIGVMILPVSLFTWARWDSINRDKKQELEKELDYFNIYAEKVINEQDSSNLSKISVQNIWDKLIEYDRNKDIEQRLQNISRAVLFFLNNEHLQDNDIIYDTILRRTKNIAIMVKNDDRVVKFLDEMDDMRIKLKNQTEQSLKNKSEDDN